MHPQLQLEWDRMVATNHPIVSQVEQTLASHLITEKIKEWNHTFGSRRPGRSDRKDIIILKDLSLYIISKDLCPILTFSKKESSIEKFEQLLAHENLLCEKALYYSELLSQNRLSLHQELHAFCQNTDPLLHFSTKPSAWFSGQDNGSESVEIQYRGRFLCDFSVSLLSGYVFSRELILRKYTETKNKINEQIASEERLRLIRRERQYTTLFQNIDSRKRLRKVDQLPDGKLIDIIGNKISQDFDVDNQKLVEDVHEEYRKLKNQILQQEDLTDITHFPPLTIDLSPRYFFTLLASQIHRTDFFQVYSSRGKNKKIRFHVFKNGRKTGSFTSKGYAYRVAHIPKTQKTSKLLI